MADREVALPESVARIGRRQPRANFQTRPVGGQRGGQIPLRAEHVADSIMADREVALPAGVARSLAAQLL